MSPITYTEVLARVESSPEKLQDLLFRFELTKLSEFVKFKTNDTRSVKEIMSIIVEELLGGKANYKTYLTTKQKLVSIV